MQTTNNNYKKYKCKYEYISFLYPWKTEIAKLFFLLHIFIYFYWKGIRNSFFNGMMSISFEFFWVIDSSSVSAKMKGPTYKNLHTCDPSINQWWYVCHVWICFTVTFAHVRALHFSLRVLCLRKRENTSICGHVYIFLIRLIISSADR